MEFNFGYRQMIFLLVIFLYFISRDHVNGRGGRGGGGSRGGGSRGSSSRGSSSRGSSSRGSTSRSSGSRGGFSGTSRGSSSYGSVYVSTVPSMRYTPSYSSSRMGSTHWYYYGFYAGYATRYHNHRPRMTSSMKVCVNYEANVNDTSMGVFVCPLPFEPNNYNDCCGDDYAEFCCDAKKGTNVVGIIVGIFFAIVAIILIWVFYKKYSERQKSRSGTGMVISVSQPNHVPATGDNGAVYTSNTAYEPPTGVVQPPPYPQEKNGYDNFNGAAPYPMANGGQPAYPPQPSDPYYQPVGEAGGPGYPVQQPGYPPQPGYAPQPGYPDQATYPPQPAYPPQPTYPPQPGMGQGYGLPPPSDANPPPPTYEPKF